MKIEYDRYAKALYIKLQDKKPDRTLEINEKLNLDIDAQGNLIGIEILNPDEYPLKEILHPSVEEYTEEDAEIVKLTKETA